MKIKYFFTEIASLKFFRVKLNGIKYHVMIDGHKLLKYSIFNDLFSQEIYIYINKEVVNVNIEGGRQPKVFLNKRNESR